MVPPAHVTHFSFVRFYTRRFTAPHGQIVGGRCELAVCDVRLLTFRWNELSVAAATDAVHVRGLRSCGKHVEFSCLEIKISFCLVPRVHDFDNVARRGVSISALTSKRVDYVYAGVYDLSRHVVVVCIDAIIFFSAVSFSSFLVFLSPPFQFNLLVHGLTISFCVEIS